jgi:hypothetical protein
MPLEGENHLGIPGSIGKFPVLYDAAAPAAETIAQFQVGMEMQLGNIKNFKIIRFLLRGAHPVAHNGSIIGWKRRN